MAPPYRLIALDIDGTLLDPHSEVRPRVRGAIRQATEAGCQVVLATGRRFRSAKPIADDLGLSLPIILHAGALVRDPSTGEVLHAGHVPLPAARAVVQAAFALGLQPIVAENAYVEHRSGNLVAAVNGGPEAQCVGPAVDGGIHCADFVTGVLGERLFAGPPELDSEPARLYLERYRSLVVRRPPGDICGDRPPLHLAVLDREEVIRQLLTTLGGIEACVASVSVIPRFSCHVLDVTARGSSKADALRFLARRIGVSMDEVIAVGDNGNDLEMLRAAGLGVAVANASAELKAVADCLVASNAEDGVAEAIERFVLG